MSARLRALWLDATGKHGWAVGDGVVLHYDGTLWQRDDTASKASGGKTLWGLWLDTEGKRGLAVGYRGLVLYYDGIIWRRNDAASGVSGRKNLRALWLDADGKRGWAVGDDGVVLSYDGALWQRDDAASEASGGTHLWGLWLDAEGKRGWAVGDGGVVLHYDGKRWKRDGTASRASDLRALHALWLDAEGKHGWAVGGDGVVLSYDGALWQRDDVASGASDGKTLWGLCLDTEGKRGLAVGDGGVVLGYDGTRWRRDHEASEASGGKALGALWRDAKGERGWAVGEDGVMLSFRPDPIGSVAIDPTVADFSGIASLRFEGAAPLTRSLKLSILDQQGAMLVPDDPHYLTIRQVEGNLRAYEVHFQLKAGEIARRTAGQPFQLRVTADFGDLHAPTQVTFVPDRSLYVKGSYWLLPYIYGAVTILLVNLGLVVAAIYSHSARRMALDPTIRMLVGVGIFKYLLTEPLLVYVPAVRKALFRDYRHHLHEHPQLARWTTSEYIRPRISSSSLCFDSFATVPQQAGANDHTSTEAREPLPIEAVLQTLSAKSNSRRQLWLIEGQSGLGKSAFLQQIARAALNRGMTPLLLPLGSEQAPEQEVATLMSEYGDMNVSPTTAMDMVDGGGFVILMDALNEDRQSQATLSFVRRARKRNLLLLSSQFSPSWPQNIPIERLNLAPFEREQLERILPTGWADRVLQASYLSPIAGLPITALLLSKYISRNASLPATDFAIYTSLCQDLDQNETLNLERQAWDLFKSNGQQFKADGRLTEEFCEDAVRKGVLTRRSVGKEAFYRFVHERVHRYFVARYLVRQDELTLSKWHEKLDPGFGKAYWADVIEFLAATYAFLEKGIDARTRTYTSFLREAAEFAPRVFSERLYHQYQRYRDAGDVSRDPAFEDWAASFLAEVVSGKRGA